jgi:FkbM family methyltransferase
MFLQTIDSKDLIKEIFGDNYGVLRKKVEFSPGDVILDIGANEGMFSIMMAKLFPQTRVIAFEPVPRTYEVMLRNLKINKVENVTTSNLGLGAVGKNSAVMCVSKEHSGGSSGMITFVEKDMFQVQVGLISLDEVFETYHIDRCRLLKMDIEGMEYEVLYPSNVLNRVDYFAGEVHYNRKLDFESRRADGLLNWLSMKTNILSAAVCQMCE